MCVFTPDGKGAILVKCRGGSRAAKEGTTVPFCSGTMLRGALAKLVQSPPVLGNSTLRQNEKLLTTNRQVRKFEFTIGKGIELCKTVISK